MNILLFEYSQTRMDIISTYKCLCDETRLRILNVLKEGPLCVCHLQEVLEVGQVKISKQLSYLKKFDVLKSKRLNNWNIYELTDKSNSILENNLKCLQDCSQEMGIFKNDLERLESLLNRIDLGEISCPAEIEKLSRGASSSRSHQIKNRKGLGC